jgi:hypothetical protein
MFVGHYSAAFLAKRIAPEIPLPVYFVACQTIDLFWATFVLLGIEKVRFVDHITASNSMDLYFMPFTHSLSGALVWAVGIASLYWLLGKENPHRFRNTILFGVVVLSHWILDFFAHRPDLPLWHDSFKVGLGLWNFQLFECLLELALLWASIFLALKVVDQNRKHFMMLGAVMTALQIICTLMPTPEQDYKMALQLLLAYSVMTLFAYLADRKAMQPIINPA